MADEPELDPVYYGLEGLGHITELREEEVDEDPELERAIDAALRAGGVELDPVVGFGRPSSRRRRV